MEFNKRRPIEKAQSRRRRDEPSKEACNPAAGGTIGPQSAAGGLKPLLIKRRMTYELP